MPLMVRRRRGRGSCRAPACWKAGTNRVRLSGGCRVAARWRRVDPFGGPDAAFGHVPSTNCLLRLLDVQVELSGGIRERARYAALATDLVNVSTVPWKTRSGAPG